VELPQTRSASHNLKRSRLIRKKVDVNRANKQLNKTQVNIIRNYIETNENLIKMHDNQEKKELNSGTTGTVE